MKRTLLAGAALCALLIPSLAAAQTQPTPSALGQSGFYIQTAPSSIVVAPAGGQAGPGTVVAADRPFPVSMTPAAAVPSVDASGTVTLGGTYQVLFAASTARKGCTIYNPPTATEVLNVRFAGASVYSISVGGQIQCGFPGGVISSLVEVTAPTTGHAFTAAQQ